VDSIVIASLVILTVLAAALVVQLALLARRVGRLVDMLEKDLPPLLEKADDVVDSMQDQLKRVESVVESAHGVNERLHAAANTANNLFSSPLARIASFAAEAGRSRFGKRKSRSSDE